MSLFEVPQKAVIAEWLNRWTQNPWGLPSVGLNPASSALTIQSLIVTCHWGLDMDNAWTCPLIQVLRIDLP